MCCKFTYRIVLSGIQYRIRFCILNGPIRYVFQKIGVQSGLFKKNAYRIVQTGMFINNIIFLIYTIRLQHSRTFCKEGPKNGCAKMGFKKQKHNLFTLVQMLSSTLALD